MDPIQEKKIDKFVRVMDRGSIAILENHFELEEKINELEEVLTEKIDEVKEIAEENQKMEGPKGEKGGDGIDGYTPVKGKDYFTEADKKEIASKIDVPVVEKVVEKIEIIREQPIVKNEIVKEITIDKTQTGEEIVGKINELPTDEDKYLIGAEHIKDLKDLITEIVKKIKDKTIFVGGGSSGGGRIVRSYDLSSQLNGSTRVFTTPAMWRVISVHLSSFPNILRETVDYTWTPSSLTLTSEIPDESLASGQTLILVYAEA